MGAVPRLTDVQRRAALDKAMTARRERAEVKEALKRGRLSLYEALASDSEAMRKMPVRTLLESLPQIGQVRAQRLLAEMGIAPGRRLRGLGPRQRQRLLEWSAPRS
ncbi:integration host factor, actinobacterial type [Streptomyces sp. NPDC048266]|uniref:integration host factor, actinobacterial type n=1 Tax=Streptomyces sp. NPDC048266 TaxID=3155787 RepID=UPI0033DBEA34